MSGAVRIYALQEQNLEKKANSSQCDASLAATQRRPRAELRWRPPLACRRNDMRKKMMSIGASSVTLPKHLQTADPKQITLQGSDNSLLHVQGSQVDLEDLVAAIDSGETDLWLQPDVRVFLCPSTTPCALPRG